MKQAKEMIKAFNKANKHASSLIDNIMSDEIYGAMTDEQKKQFDELRKDSKILSSQDLDKKKETIKKYTT